MPHDAGTVGLMLDDLADERPVPGSTYVGYCLQGLRRCGDRVAFSHGDTHMTGYDALALVYRMSSVLRDRGLLPGMGVAVLSGNRPEAFLLQVAAQLAGARHTGLHGMASARRSGVRAGGQPGPHACVRSAGLCATR